MHLSIVTVTRNNFSGLRSTADSIASQSFPDIEWIVIDGASTDETRKYLATQADVKWISEPDQGIYDAMNKGIGMATGDHVLFLNAGDTLAAEDTLEKIIPHLANADFFYGDSLEETNYKPARSHTRAAQGMFTHHQAMIYRRDLIGDLRYDARYKIAADYKFTLEFLRRCRVIHVASLPVCRFETGGISQNHVKTGRIEQFRVRKELKFCPPALNCAIYAAQTILMALRRAFPGLYWRLKQLRA
jgi:putative colanic acid biosynthesis glycosyltransferase